MTDKVAVALGASLDRRDAGPYKIGWTVSFRCSRGGCGGRLGGSDRFRHPRGLRNKKDEQVPILAAGPPRREGKPLPYRVRVSSTRSHSGLR